MSSANRRLVIFLPPMLTFPSCSFRASDMIRSRKCWRGWVTEDAKIIVRYKKIGYNIDVLWQTVCVVVIKSRLTTLPLLLHDGRSGLRLNEGTILKPNLIVTWAIGDWHPFRVVLGRAYRGLTKFNILRRIMTFSERHSVFIVVVQKWRHIWVSFAHDFQFCYFCESSYLFYLRFNLISMFLR